MKIMDQYIAYKTDIISITGAKYMGDYSIKIRFADGTEKQVDFKPFLSNSLHPSVSKYLNEDLFKEFEIINGNLNWNDYNLIFPVSELYDGKINH